MTQRTHDEPFDLQRWADSVGDRTVVLTARSPEADDSRPTAPGLRPPEPVECGLCGEEVLPVGADLDEGGHCPNCGFEPGAEP